MSIRILHTSDWHLGKRLYKVERLGEQKLFLEWLLEIVTDKKIDYLLIAGDIFDTPSPPNEALKVYFDFLQNITTKTKCKIIIIAGNHDSGKFLEAPYSLLRSHNIQIFGRLNENPNKHLITLKPDNSQDSDLEIDLVAIPYFRNFEILNMKKNLQFDSDLDSSEDIVVKIMDRFIDASLVESKNKQRILMAHHLFAGFLSEGSEQSLSLSGVESFPTDFLENRFDYVALGHIHKPQITKNENPHIYYCGSPIPMRFSESKNKSVAFLEFKDDAPFHKELIPIPIFRHLLVIKCDHGDIRSKIEKIIENDSSNGLATLLEIHIELADPIAGLSDSIREQLQGSNIELLSLFTIFSKNKNDDNKITKYIGNKLPDTIELFSEFYRRKHPNSQEVPAEIRNDFMKLLERISEGVDTTQ